MVIIEFSASLLENHSVREALRDLKNADRIEAEHIAGSEHLVEIVLYAVSVNITCLTVILRTALANRRYVRLKLPDGTIITGVSPADLPRLLKELKELKDDPESNPE